jgi:diguanylate cyclase (GGDEF)-like protein
VEANHEGERLMALAQAGRALASVSCLDGVYALTAELALGVLGASSAAIVHGTADDSRFRVLGSAGTPTGAGDVAISLPVVVGSSSWGEIRAGRSTGLPPFEPATVAAGEALGSLVGAALARIADREELHSLAYRDGLTGLGNRRTIDDRLEELFQPAVLPEPIGVILCDVDRLKNVNDLHGHLAGDRLLREVGTLLADVAAGFPRSLAARIGGDEFCLLIEGDGAGHLDEVTERIVAAADLLPMSAGLSCGWAVADRRPGGAPTATVAARALLRLADAAQYRAKRAGREARPTESTTTAAMDTAATGALLADQVIAELADAGDHVGSRLAVVAVTFASLLAAPSWTVSVSVDGGPVTVVEHDEVGPRGPGDGLQVQPGAGFALVDYPATAQALEGGSFHATIDVGDDAERAFLAADGYDEVIGAGARENAARAWLVEVVGDAYSPPLAPYRGVLRAMVELALRPTVVPAELVAIGTPGTLSEPRAGR